MFLDDFLGLPLAGAFAGIVIVRNHGQRLLFRGKRVKPERAGQRTSPRAGVDPGDQGSQALPSRWRPCPSPPRTPASSATEVRWPDREKERFFRLIESALQSEHRRVAAPVWPRRAWAASALSGFFRFVTAPAAITALRSTQPSVSSRRTRPIARASRAPDRPACDHRHRPRSHSSGTGSRAISAALARAEESRLHEVFRHAAFAEGVQNHGVVAAALLFR